MIPKNVTLEGTRARLEPLAARHAEDLQRNCNEPALWEFTFQLNPFHSITESRAWVAQTIAAPDQAAFAIVDKTSGEAIESTRYLDIQPVHRASNLRPKLSTPARTLRNFRIRPTDREVRDVAFYSIVAQDWPHVREDLSRKANTGVDVAGAVAPFRPHVPA